MNLIQHFAEAFESLASNKLRSGLTMLGIVIGVAAVISMLAIGNGAQASISNSINSIGTNLLFVSSGARGVRNAKPLTMDDASALSSLSSVSNVSAYLQGRAAVTYLSQSEDTSLLGVTADYQTVRNLVVEDGQFITDADLTGRAQVAVIGATTATNLFGETSGVVGNAIKVNGTPFQIVGVLQSKGGSSLGSQDDQVIIPLTTAQSRLLKRNPANRVVRSLFKHLQRMPSILQKMKSPHC
jgi:putative ABC transport system permease protein